MSITAFDSYFKRLNNACKETLGYDEELWERPFLDCVHFEDTPATQQAIKRLTEGELIGDFTNRFRSKQGRYRLIQWRGVADMKRKVIYAVARDITDTRNLEEQLQQSRKMEAIGRLAGGVAHDFNNVLQAIQGNIESAQLDPGLSAVTLPNALAATRRAAALTRQLLTFGQRRELTSTVLNLGSFLEDLMSLLQRLLPENIAGRIKTNFEAEAVLADPSQMEQVAVNLCLGGVDQICGRLHPAGRWRG